MTKQKVQIGIAVVVALLVVGVFLGNNLFSMSQSNAGSTSGLVVQDRTVGTGRAAQPGDTVSVNYTGKLADGTVFDTSVGRPPAPGCKQGFCFTLGAGQVIQGWDLGLQGMQVGGTRTLIIPPTMAYGPQDYGPIPANSTLTFEVQMLAITPGTSTSAAQ